MADITDHGTGFGFAGGDLPFKNYGASLDISAGQVVIMDTTSGHLMGVLAPVSSGSVAGSIGVAVDNIPAGKTGRVRCFGAAVCTAHGGVTAGAMVQASNTTAHLGQVKTALAATFSVGFALTTALDGDPVLVLIHPATNADALFLGD